MASIKLLAGLQLGFQRLRQNSPEVLESRKVREGDKRKRDEQRL